MSFLEDLLFTHRGLSGPAVLQISSYWQPGTPLAHRPRARREDGRSAARRQGPLEKAHRQRTGRNGCRRAWPTPGRGQDAALARPINEAADRALAQLAERISRWQITPSGTEGYRRPK